MTKLGDSALRAIRERAASATRGPWVTDSGNRVVAKDESTKKITPLLYCEMPISLKKDARDDQAAVRSVIAQEVLNAKFIAKARADIPDLLDHAAEMKHECDRFREENERLWAEQEALRNTVLAIRNRLHTKGWGPISNQARLEMRDLCNDTLCVTQPRAWKATHRDAAGNFYKQLFTATNSCSGETVAVFESLDRGRWIQVVTDLKEIARPSAA